MTKKLTLILLCFVLACQNGSEESSPKLAGNTYQGVIPCADCSGIAFTVLLQKGNEYTTQSMYLGESNRTFTEEGIWQVKNDTLLVLQNEDEEEQLFSIEENQLVMLDKKGQRINGTLANNYILAKLNRDSAKKEWPEKQKQGIDFRAVGNEPFWGLDVNFEEMMVFRSLGGDTLKMPTPEIQQEENTGVRLIEAETESGTLAVSLLPVGCVDTMSGEVFKYAVEVKVNEKTYEGCGEFINPAYKLNGFWALYSIGGKKINKSDISFEVPALQFAVAEQKVYGNTGCNQLSGTFSTQDSSITFSKMITTKRACMGENPEQAFLKALQNTNTFDISNGTLILLQNSDTLLVFRKGKPGV